MYKICLLATMLLSAQAALIKNTAWLKQISGGDGQYDRWETQVERACAIDEDSEARTCIMYDEASDRYLGLTEGSLVWQPLEDAPEWLDQLEEGIEDGSDIEVETQAQFWEFDTEDNSDSAYMYDVDNEAWFVRDAESGNWLSTTEWDSIPDWVWEASGHSKDDHVNGDDEWVGPDSGYCADGCPNSWVGDVHWCDDVCWNAACNWDGGDCLEEYGEPPCAEGCGSEQIGDGTCDEACNVEACGLDDGDCYVEEEDEDDLEPGHCAPGCPDAWVGDVHWCDDACYNEACNWDGGDCDEEYGPGGDSGSDDEGEDDTGSDGDGEGEDDDTGSDGEGEGEDDDAGSDDEFDEPGYCAPGCPDAWVGDVHWCDDACWNEACNWDGGDCDDEYGPPPTPECAEGCADEKIGDGWCDEACNVEACDFDGEDCVVEEEEAECDPECPAYWIGDGWCDAVCNTDACGNDGGDCDSDSAGGNGESSDCAPGCPDYWMGDGYCDQHCLTEECNYDGGDCSNSFLQMNRKAPTLLQRKRKDSFIQKRKTAFIEKRAAAKATFIEQKRASN